MTEKFSDRYKDKPRRETLVALMQAFDDEQQLKALAEDNVMVACSLALLSMNDAQLHCKLTRYLDVGELYDDIAHVKESEHIRKQRKEMRV